MPSNLHPFVAVFVCYVIVRLAYAAENPNCGKNELLSPTPVCCEPTCDDDCSLAVPTGYYKNEATCVCKPGYVRHKSRCIRKICCPRNVTHYVEKHTTLNYPTEPNVDKLKPKPPTSYGTRQPCRRKQSYPPKCSQKLCSPDVIVYEIQSDAVYSAEESPVYEPQVYLPEEMYPPKQPLCNKQDPEVYPPEEPPCYEKEPEVYPADEPPGTVREPEDYMSQEPQSYEPEPVETSPSELPNCEQEPEVYLPEKLPNYELEPEVYQPDDAPNCEPEANPAETAPSFSLESDYFPPGMPAPDDYLPEELVYTYEPETVPSAPLQPSEPYPSKQFGAKHTEPPRVNSRRIVPYSYQSPKEEQLPVYPPKTKPSCTEAPELLTSVPYYVITAQSKDYTATTEAPCITTKVSYVPQRYPTTAGPTYQAFPPRPTFLPPPVPKVTYPPATVAIKDCSFRCDQMQMLTVCRPCCVPTCKDNCINASCARLCIAELTCICVAGYVLHEGKCIRKEDCPPFGYESDSVEDEVIPEEKPVYPPPNYFPRTGYTPLPAESLETYVSDEDAAEQKEGVETKVPYADDCDEYLNMSGFDDKLQ